MDKNSFALRPPMGWNSYDYYDTNVNEAQVLANAEFMAKHLKPYGWEYIVVDIQWYGYGTASLRDKYQYIPFARKEMDGWGRLLPCPEKFPSGFHCLADRIHALGLKFGIHIMRGIPRTAAELHLPILGADATADEVADPSSICPWNPDMYGVREGAAGQAYYDSLLALYAQWGVDLIKCDDLGATGFGPVRDYSRRHEVEMLHRAIEKCGRPVVLSLSPGPALVEEGWHYSKYANMWRITDDFWDDWGALLHMFERCEKWQSFVGPGCWPDCDMLPLGKVGKMFGRERDTRLRREEQKTMLSLWCIFGSPLMLGAELTLLDGKTLELLTNRALLHLQSGGFVSRQVERTRERCVWAAAHPRTGERYVALFNLSEAALELAADLSACAGVLTGLFPAGRARWTEVWSGAQTDAPAGMVPSHGVLLFRSLEETE